MATNPFDPQPDAFNKFGHQFLQTFPTNELCLAAIYTFAGIDLAHCRYCRSEHVELRKRLRVLYCRSCRRKYRLLAGTKLAYIKKPMLWWGIIWLTQHGIPFCANQISQLVSCSPPAAWHAMRAIAILKLELMESQGEAKSSEFLEAECRRSIETPAHEHPQAEEERAQKQYAEQMDRTAKNSCSADSTYTTRQGADPPPATAAAWNCPTQSTPGQAMPEDVLEPDWKTVYEHISEKEVPGHVLCDRIDLPVEIVLSSLTMLVDHGFVKCLPHDRFIRASKSSELSNNQIKLTEGTIRAIRSIISFLLATFRGISRKYLQTYIADCWFYFKRNQFAPNDLIRACFRSGHTPNRKTRDFNTDLIVKVFQH